MPYYSCIPHIRNIILNIKSEVFLMLLFWNSIGVSLWTGLLYIRNQVRVSQIIVSYMWHTTVLLSGSPTTFWKGQCVKRITSLTSQDHRNIAVCGVWELNRNFAFIRGVKRPKHFKMRKKNQRNRWNKYRCKGYLLEFDSLCWIRISYRSLMIATIRVNRSGTKVNCPLTTLTNYILPDLLLNIWLA